MKVKYIGDKYKVVLLKDKVYDVISVEGDAYRIMTEAENDGIFIKVNLKSSKNNRLNESRRFSYITI